MTARASAQKDKQSTTVIRNGYVFYRSRPLTRDSAIARAQDLVSNKKDVLTDIAVRVIGQKVYIECRPVLHNAARKLAEKEIAKRVQRMAEVREYQWLRIGDAAWHCVGGTDAYTQFISAENPKCTCHDWAVIRSIGGKCKHYLVAEEMEAKYQAGLQAAELEAEPIEIPAIGPQLTILYGEA